MGYSNGTEWTDEKIRDAVKAVIKELGLSYMPSFSQMRKFYGNYKLTNAIAKRGGVYQLATELGLPIKDSETYVGKSQEKEVADELSTMGYEVRRMSQNFPYDLLVDDCIKVDVKASRLYRGKTGNFYSFNLEKPYCTCDVYILRLLSDSGDPEGTLVVPSKFVPAQNQISVGETSSKYYRFRDRWDYMEIFRDFFSSVG